MNRSSHSCFCSSALALLVLASFFTSCERQNVEGRGKGWNPQAKKYLDSMAEKEASNLEKGWDHVEGEGYYFNKPNGWIESKDMQKGDYFLLTSPSDDLKIRLTSRYIESIPKGVHDLSDWAQLQYSSMGMPEALEETRKIEVADGDALEAWIKIGDSSARVRYFLDMFQNPENQRMWLLLVEAKERSRLESPEVQDFLDTFRVDNFRWID